MNKIRIFTSNQLKILACITMLIDHIGAILLPNLLILRIIGRLSFPIFAFMIAEGAKYTRNKLRYLLTILITGIIFQIILIVFIKDYHFNILLTFSISIIVIYSMDLFKKCLFDKNQKIIFKALSFLLFVVVAILPYFLPKIFDWFHYSYGFYGCMCAVFASAPTLDKTEAPAWLKKLDNIYVRIACMAIPLFLYSRNNIIQLYSFISLFILLLYSEKRGKAKLKYFFYIFYPAHLLILYAISFMI